MPLLVMVVPLPPGPTAPGPTAPPPVQVLVRWACDKISTSAATLGDEELLDALQVGGAGCAIKRIQVCVSCGCLPCCWAIGHTGLPPTSLSSSGACYNRPLLCPASVRPSTPPALAVAPQRHLR